jgi:hypothetical protein
MSWRRDPHSTTGNATRVAEGIGARLVTTPGILIRKADMPETTKAKKTGPSSPSTAARRGRKPQLPPDSDIARRAYELFMARGGQHGADVDDWLMATRELTQADR